LPFPEHPADGLGACTWAEDLVAEIVADLMLKMDVDKDGVVSMSDFMQWSNVNKLEGVVEDYYAEMVARQQQ